MPPPRAKRQKREQSGPRQRSHPPPARPHSHQQQQQQHNDDEDEDRQQQQEDTAALSPPTKPSQLSSTRGSGELPQPAPIEQLHLSSLAAHPSPPATSSVSSLSAPSASRARAKLIVVLVKAGLETIKTKKGHELVTADTHSSLLLRLKKDPSEFRPDIVHQCLLTLLDSPLNKAGLLQVFVQTDQHVLIEVNPATRIPRTFKRFAGLMGNTTLHNTTRHSGRTTLASCTFRVQLARVRFASTARCAAAAVGVSVAARCVRLHVAHPFVRPTAVCLVVQSSCCTS